MRQTHSQFWVAHLQQEVVFCLAEKAVDVLIQFGTTYLCESGFSTLAYRNRLHAEQDLRVAQSKTGPRIDMLVEASTTHTHTHLNRVVCARMCFLLYICVIKNKHE